MKRKAKEKTKAHVSPKTLIYGLFQLQYHQKR